MPTAGYVIFDHEINPLLAHLSEPAAPWDTGPLLNIGTGTDVTIRELAETVMRVVGFEGRITFDDSKPDGTPRKLLDVSRLAELGWRAAIPLETGIAQTYESAPFRH
jgi:GDP-L-fucose synthase